MKVGVFRDDVVKKIAKERQMTYSDALLKICRDNLLCRISRCSFAANLWLRSSSILSEASLENTCTFYYIESAKEIAAEKLVAGQKMSESLLRLMMDEICGFLKSTSYFGVTADVKEMLDNLHFTYEIAESEDKLSRVSINTHFDDLRIPLNLRFIAISGKDLHPQNHELAPIYGGKQVALMTFNVENRLADYFYEIINKLELISNMEAYDKANEILKNESVSGREVMELILEKTKKSPKVLKEIRIAQVEDYRDYSYMKKRWNSYEKINCLEHEDWELVVDRITGFGRPLWGAICNNEIFFDDWMPGLGRFLG